MKKNNLNEEEIKINGLRIEDFKKHYLIDME
jgi:hypothetical protein